MVSIDYRDYRDLNHEKSVRCEIEKRERTLNDESVRGEIKKNFTRVCKVRAKQKHDGFKKRVFSFYSVNLFGEFEKNESKNTSYIYENKIYMRTLLI